MKYLILLCAVLIFIACGQNHHLTELNQNSILGPIAVIVGVQPSNPIGVNNSKVGIIGQFDDTSDYKDDDSNPSIREKEWIFEVNDTEVGRINYATLATAITNLGANPSSTHSQLIVDDWVSFLDDISGATAGTDLVLGDEICVSTLAKNSDGEISVNPSTKVCFFQPQKDIYTYTGCLLYTSPSPRDQRGSRMPSSA